MTHNPSGQGQADAIKRNAEPAILHKKDDDSQMTDNWRPSHNVATEAINVYIILDEEQMALEDEGEDSEQGALIYNVEKKLQVGWVVEVPEHGWFFLIKKSTQRPARNPAYFKSRGVMRS